MPYTEFGCLPTVIGSMPDTDPSGACAQVTRYLKDIPAWPQLPKRSFLENMYVQFCQGFPGVVVGDNRIYVDRSQELDKPLELLYAAYLENDVDKYPIDREHAVGLYSFLDMDDLSTGWSGNSSAANGRAVLARIFVTATRGPRI